MQTFIGNDEAAATHVVSELQPDKPIQVVSHGNDNLIILCGNDVFRFPRSAAVWERGQVEQFVLEKLREHPEIPAPILKHVHEDPAYTISVALDGHVLENEDIRTLSTSQQAAIGKQIGEVAYAFHTLLSPEDIRPFLTEKHPQAWYAEYLEKVLPDVPEPYADLAAWVLDEWPKHDHSESTVIHDDLHSHNMLFDDAKSLSGVLDFGDVNIGNPEQDLRYTYWMGDAVLESTIATYMQLADRPLDAELIKLCALSQELSGLADAKRSYMHERARTNLSFRFADIKS